jgi:hypothetical protein
MPCRHCQLQSVSPMLCHHPVYLLGKPKNHIKAQQRGISNIMTKMTFLFESRECYSLVFMLVLVFLRSKLGVILDLNRDTYTRHIF